MIILSSTFIMYALIILVPLGLLAIGGILFVIFNSADATKTRPAVRRSTSR